LNKFSNIEKNFSREKEIFDEKVKIKEESSKCNDLIQKQELTREEEDEIIDESLKWLDSLLSS